VLPGFEPGHIRDILDSRGRLRKLGNLHLDFSDLTIRVADAPITIDRTDGVRGQMAFGCSSEIR
jgi:hypothetical protein